MFSFFCRNSITWKFIKPLEIVDCTAFIKMIYFSFFTILSKQSNNNTQKPDWCINIIQFVGGFWRVFVGSIYDIWILIYDIAVFAGLGFPAFCQCNRHQTSWYQYCPHQIRHPKVSQKRGVARPYYRWIILWKCFNISCGTSNVIFLYICNTYTLFGYITWYAVNDISIQRLWFYLIKRWEC